MPDSWLGDSCNLNHRHGCQFSLQVYSGGQFAVFLGAGHDFKQVIYNSKGDVCIAHLDIRWKPSALYSNAGSSEIYAGTC